jgi:RNA 2',3'-cyclic 3'-phosphodiesterase
VEAIGRVFAAVPVPGAARVDLVDRIARLEIPGRVVPPENWHITLRFLGMVDPVTYERFLFGMEPPPDVGPFRIRLGAVGAFPNPERAAVIWAGVEAGDGELSRLAGLAEEAAVSSGLAAEERPFSPHLTLSRVRPPVDVCMLIGEKIGVGWLCDRVVIYRSIHGPGGARYEPLETFDLTR